MSPGTPQFDSRTVTFPDAARTAASPRSFWRSDLVPLFAIALSTLLLHSLTGNRYGFNRDELSLLDDARHLSWGYVAYPPITPLFARLSLLLFGHSLPGFRFFSWLVQAVAVALTGLMARELGGSRRAQIIAALAAVPFCLGGGALMTYISFDYLCWVLAACFVLRLLNTGDPRWWLAIGAALGLGMLSKYTMGFLTLGIVGAVLLTDARRYLRSKWLWLGVAISILLFLPNLLWQYKHQFVSLDFLRFIHERDVREGQTSGFLPDQVELTLLAFPLALAGLYFYFFAKNGRRFRMLGLMYVIPLVLFLIAKGRGYYLAPAYPMLYAAGAVLLDDWLAGLPTRRAKALRNAIFAALLLDVAIAIAFALPTAPVGSPWWRFAIKVNGTLQEEIGWPEFAETVAKIRDSLPAEDRARLGILAGNYGEVGALNLYGERYGLPRSISGVNSFWERGYGDPPPETLIVVGFPREWVDSHFASCQLAGHPWNRYGTANEETLENPDMFVCRGLRQPWPVFWKTLQSFR
ncbi:MAG TPA: glycosyltransferase family 39 protein [Candidatus Acidoferrum sp.]